MANNGINNHSIEIILSEKAAVATLMMFGEPIGMGAVEFEPGSSGPLVIIAAVRALLDATEAKIFAGNAETKSTLKS